MIKITFDFRTPQTEQKEWKRKKKEVLSYLTINFDTIILRWTLQIYEKNIYWQEIQKHIVGETLWKRNWQNFSKVYY